MKILVTGGAGFIGSHVIDACRNKGWDVVCVDSLDPGVHHGAPHYLRDDVDYCFADLRYWKPDRRFDDVNAIVHLAALGGVSRAAKEPANIITSNAGGTARLVDMALGLPNLVKIVHASSFSVYGANYQYRIPSSGKVIDASRKFDNLEKGIYDVVDDDTGEIAIIQPIDETATPNPLEIYGASKYMQELCYRGFGRCPVTILRFSSVYGKRLRLDDGEATIIARLAGWIRSGERPKLFEDGQQIRDWVYVGDVVEAIVAILEGKEAPLLLNVCSGIPTTLLRACKVIQETMNVDCKPVIVGGNRQGDMRHCLGDPSELAKILGRSPTSFAEGARLAFSDMDK